jgi:tetratricopeptide (TPR) repeat protein
VETTPVKIKAKTKRAASLSLSEKDGERSTDKPRGLRRLRRWVLRCARPVLFTLVLLALVELGLRLAGYGVPMRFAIEREIGGRTMWVDNPHFTWQFFGKHLARDGRPFALTPTKPDGTVRIFVMGGSAAQGFPEPAFSIARFLDVMLSDRYPDVEFEVVNAGITAINSHVVLPIADSCAGMDPDLFVVYLGNNEVVGPFGAGTVFNPAARSRTLIRTGLAFRTTRLGQLLKSILPSAGKTQAWQGMEMFLDQKVRAGDETLQRTYRHFRANLRDICGKGTGAGAAVVLSTVAVNLADCPPFASLHRPDLTPAELTRWEKAYERAARLEQQGQWAAAVEAYTQAKAIDADYAELHFGLGRCHRERDRLEDARRCFGRARDLDVLRFRADSRINTIIREVAADRASEGVILADAARQIDEHAPDGIPGSELFYEHVHLRFAGAYRVARGLLPAVEQALAPEMLPAAPDRTPLSAEACAERLGLTELARYDALSDIVSIVQSPPFTNQRGHAMALRALRREMESLRPWTEGEKLEVLLDQYARITERKDLSIDFRLHLAFLLLDCTQRPERAEDVLRPIAETVPSRGVIRGLLLSLLRQGRHKEAEELYRRAAAQWPWDSSFHNYMGDAYFKAGDVERATMYFRKARDVYPDSMAHNNMGAALRKQGRLQEALDAYERALRARPDSPQGHDGMGLVLADLERFDEAVAHFKDALQLDPDHLDARSNLGAVLVMQKRYEEAVAQYRRVLEVDPDHFLACYGLGVARVRQGRLREAEAVLVKACALNPEHPNAREQLARVRDVLQRRDGAER